MIPARATALLLGVVMLLAGAETASAGGFRPGTYSGSTSQTYQISFYVTKKRVEAIVTKVNDYDCGLADQMISGLSARIRTDRSFVARWRGFVVRGTLRRGRATGKLSYRPCGLSFTWKARRTGALPRELRRA